ncbi:MAG: DUF1343 domain-containing protein [Sedimentisphaerales bacterium]|nr:DUF1343 domain-containing protein [Sedimentisphaerales bacterium]
MKHLIIVLVVAAGMSLCSCRAAVTTGLDNVALRKELFRGKRIGIVTNHTAVNTAGVHIVDVLSAVEGAKVTALFGPEHGIRGTQAAGKEIESSLDEKIPIYSLYGDTKKPTPKMLENLDLLVFDIQDVGARFYTYTYTMALAMEAAAENGKKFVVLDRPNPINGLAVEGNCLQSDYASFVGLYPIPVRHGMTTGEMAKMFNDRGWLKSGAKADLVVIPMQGWRRSMWYDQTALKFIKPSPNITDLQTAAVYPGLCLLEGANVSEGRGTPKPFLQFGAPWIDAEDLAAGLNSLNLPGLRFEPAVFTPNASKHAGKQCYGARITITRRDLLDAYWSGILIVNEIHRMYPKDFQWRAGHFDRLCGTGDVRLAISSGASLQDLKQHWQAELEAFLQIRKKYLLYKD